MSKGIKHDIKFNLMWPSSEDSIFLVLFKENCLLMFHKKTFYTLHSREENNSLKGVWHEIFDFLWIGVPRAPECSIGAVSILYENSQRIFANEYLWPMSTHHSNKLFTGVSRVNCSLLIVQYWCLFLINVINTTASCVTCHVTAKVYFCLQSHSCQGFEKVEGDKMVICLMCSYVCCNVPKSSVLVDIPI